MTDLPLKTDLTSGTTTEADFQSAIGDQYDFLAQLAIHGDPYASEVDGSGNVTPDRAYIQVDTGGLVAADNLNHIIPTTIGDKMVFVRSTNSSRVITVKHNVSGTGKIFLNGASDFVLRDPSYFLALQWDATNSRWQEAFRNVPNYIPAAEIPALQTALGLGTAAFVNTGISTGQIPLKENFGTAAFVNTGTSTGQVPLSNQLGTLAFKSQVTSADMDGSGVSPGTYNQVTVNAQGRVTAASNTVTGPFQTSYTSPETSWVNGSVATFNHGLGVTPKLVIAELVCKVVDLDYAVGDRIVVTSWIFPSSQNYGSTVTYSLTQIFVTIGSSGYNVSYKSGVNKGNLTSTSWKLVAKAWA